MQSTTIYGISNPSSMTQEFNYSTSFVLDKKYYRECFEQSVSEVHSWRSYAKAIFFVVFGALLVIFTPISSYVAWFVFGLGIVEALSVYYQKPWWVTRQMLSKAANGKVTLTIDEKSISSHSHYVDDVILWGDVKTLEQTPQGWLVYHNKGKNYLSQGFLNEEVEQFFNAKCKLLK